MFAVLFVGFMIVRYIVSYLVPGLTLVKPNHLSVVLCVPYFCLYAVTVTLASYKEICCISTEH